jgi:hypothetical protein
VGIPDASNIHTLPPEEDSSQRREMTSNQAGDYNDADVVEDYLPPENDSNHEEGDDSDQAGDHDDDTVDDDLPPEEQ